MAIADEIRQSNQRLGAEMGMPGYAGEGRGARLARPAAPHYSGYAGDVDPRVAAAEERGRGANLARAAGGGGGAPSAGVITAPSPSPTGFRAPATAPLRGAANPRNVDAYGNPLVMPSDPQHREGAPLYHNQFPMEEGGPSHYIETVTHGDRLAARGGEPVPGTGGPAGGFRAPATAGAGERPEFTPMQVSQGGSMVMGTDRLGVQEIRGTGHPSWQVFHGAGMDEAYPGAVARWHEGMSREAGEAERERMRVAGQVEAATIGATKEGLGATLAHKALADLYHAQKAELDRQTNAREAGERGTAFDNYYKATYGGGLPKEGEPAHLAWADARLWEQSHPGEGKQRYQENHQIQEYEKLASPGNIAAAQQAYPNVKIPTPEHWAVLKQNPEIYRQAMLKFGPYLQHTMQQGGQLGGELSNPFPALPGESPAPAPATPAPMPFQGSSFVPS
jgi:hypothetical protein